jgi:type I restriction enzyme S subunit
MSFKISQICDINDNNLSKKDNIEFINYLDTANLNEGVIDELQYLEVGKDKIPSRAKRKVKINDILVSTVRPNQKHYGIIRDKKKNMIASTGFAVLTSNQNIVYPEYLYRFLTQEKITLYLQAIAETSTSAYPSIKPSVIGELEINLPELDEQKAIANILSTLDVKMEVNNQINKKLEEMSQVIFKQWFVDFEFPNEEGEPYKSSGGEMIENELGMIPKGWEVNTLNSIGKFKNGKRLGEEYRNEDGSNLVFGSNGVIGKTNEVLQNTPSIIVGRVGAYCGSIQLSLKKCWITDNAIIATPKDEEYLTFFYYSLLNISLRDLAGGSAQPLVNQRILKNIKIIKPQDELIRKFFDITFDFLKKKELALEQNEILSAIRDTLLSKLMSGEIRVPLEG